MKALPLFLAAALFVLPQARGAMDILFTDNGTDVVVTYSGSLNTTGMVDSGSFGLGGAIIPSLGDFYGNASLDEFLIASAFSSPPANFGTGGEGLADSFAGDAFGFRSGSNVLSLPNGYISGTSISGSMTFNNTDFATLGINAAGGP